ncbi:MAG: hypothetical protein COT74_07825 [Bdellovibrionales bacterium CG10_big_fil_rev_8_21_14_0_10_45_34]|nr:MAG: hypothetical protein COT74_07825 [Bdellovibrionales bacterium CG10_big_fil_rev_8_21_14_0_10_45_34]
MRPLIAICTNTFREIIRDRILYSLIIFCLLLIGFSVAVGQLSFAEQLRISTNFGLAGIQFSACALAVFVGSSLVFREIEKQTVLTLLSRAIGRATFLVGKFLGLISVVAVVVLGLSLVFLLIFLLLGGKIHENLFYALWGIFLEASILLAMTLLFGMFTKPILAVSFSIAFFLIGHWLDSLEFFASQSPSGLFATFGKSAVKLLPNLERLNWRDHVIYLDHIGLDQVLWGTVYASSWSILFLSLAAIVFARKDFV